MLKSDEPLSFMFLVCFFLVEGLLQSYSNPKRGKLPFWLSIYSLAIPKNIRINFIIVVCQNFIIQEFVKRHSKFSIGREFWIPQKFLGWNYISKEGNSLTKYFSANIGRLTNIKGTNWWKQGNSSVTGFCWKFRNHNLEFTFATLWL